MAMMLVLPLAVCGQTASMMALAQAELQKRGLNETEVRTRLMENGIDVDNIAPTEYANYQSRVIDILNKMQAEKANADTTPAATGTEIDAVTTADIPTTTFEEAVGEANAATLATDTVTAAGVDDIYGHSLFTGKSLDVFRTTDGAQAPDT